MYVYSGVHLLCLVHKHAVPTQDEFLPPSAESIVKPLAKKFDYTVGKDSVSLPSTGAHKWVIIYFFEIS